MRPLCIGGAVAGSLACLAIAGCGGSSPTHSRTASSTSAPAGASAINPSGTGTTTGAAASTTTAATTSRPPEVPTSRAKGTSKPPSVNPGGPIGGMRFPAAFTIGAGGELNPPSVAGPTGATVDLRLINHDSRAHTVAVTIPARRTFRLAAGASASAVLTGLRKGSYRVLVDGTARGQVIIGAVGGP